MPRFTFDARYPDGSPRLFAGTWRPTLQEALDANARTYRLSYQEQVRPAWERGEYDQPLYHADNDEGIEPIETERAV